MGTLNRMIASDCPRSYLTTDTSSNQRTSSSSGSLTETEVICGNPRDRRGHIKVNLASTLAVKQFQQLLNCPPDDPGRCALKLLTIFFTESELAKGNCTKAGGRELLDQHLLHGIKCKYINIMIYNIFYNKNFVLLTFRSSQPHVSTA